MTNSNRLKGAHLTSQDYQDVKNLKAFNDSDWKWNSNTGLYDRNKGTIN